MAAYRFKCHPPQDNCNNFNKPAILFFSWSDTYPDLSAIIWTTTPWSIPANEAICYMQARDYAIVQCAKTGQHLLIGAERVEEISLKIGRQMEVKQIIQGEEWRWRGLST